MAAAAAADLQRNTLRQDDVENAVLQAVGCQPGADRALNLLLEVRTGQLLAVGYLEPKELIVWNGSRSDVFLGDLNGCAVGFICDDEHVGAVLSRRLEAAA